MLRRFAPLLLLAAGAAPAASPRADALWQKGDYRGAFAAAFELAANGDAHAQFLLGEAYRLGRSVDASFPLAEDWYGRAAGQGDVEAATELGLLLAYQHRFADALPWLSFAAVHGEPRALCSLAALYFNGEGAAPDGALAFALMTRAAAAGLPEAQARLATLRTALTPELQTKGAALAAGPWAARLQPAPIVQEASSPPALGGRADFRIQVGAYGSEAAAQKAWTLLTRRLADLGQADHAIVRAGGVYRLQARFNDPTQVQSLRRRLEAAHWDHFTRGISSGT